MASTYTRAGSPYIWLRFKDEEGKWIGRPTSYRADNIGDRRQAKLVARDLSLKERESRPVSGAEYFDEWVPQWMADRYGKSQTAIVYKRHWRQLCTFLAEKKLTAPRQFQYRHVAAYMTWRTTPKKRGATGRKTATSRNTAIHELKFMGLVMKEAVRREFCASNPCLRMDLRRDAAAEKTPWTDEEIAMVAKRIAPLCHWIRCTFYLGLYQAARLRQIPRISSMDFTRNVITYDVTKGDKPFSHPMDERGRVILRALVDERLNEDPNAVFLCQIPAAPSVEWRDLLDGLGLTHLSHHGLRVTWITRAAKARVHVSQAKRFVNHGSTAVHEIYQKLSVSDIEDVPMQVPLPSSL